jgi:uncharacterized protein YbaR (Trm112 family)
VPYDFFRYTSYGLRYLAEKNGLKVISLEPSNGPLHTGMRWAYLSLAPVRSSKIAVRWLLVALKGLFKFVLIPVSTRLEAYSTEQNFPICWLMIAQRSGQEIPHNRSYTSKKEVIESIIRCPHCKGHLELTTGSYLCAHCRKRYRIENGQTSFLEKDE